MTSRLAVSLESRTICVTVLVIMFHLGSLAALSIGLPHLARSSASFFLLATLAFLIVAQQPRRHAYWWGESIFVTIAFLAAVQSVTLFAKGHFDALSIISIAGSLGILFFGALGISKLLASSSESEMKQPD